jgi:hypothetical protein
MVPKCPPLPLEPGYVPVSAGSIFMPANATMPEHESSPWAYATVGVVGLFFLYVVLPLAGLFVVVRVVRLAWNVTPR